MLLRIAEEIEERAKDAQGNVYLTIEEIKRQEEERRAGEIHCWDFRMEFKPSSAELHWHA